MKVKENKDSTKKYFDHVSIGYTEKLILYLDNSKASSKLDIPVKVICYEFEAASFGDVLDKGILPD